MKIKVWCQKCVLLLVSTRTMVQARNKGEPGNSDQQKHTSTETRTIQERIVNVKMELWSRGAYSFHDENVIEEQDESYLSNLETQLQMAPLQLGPIRQARRDVWRKQHQQSSSSNWWNQFRGGGDHVYDEKARLDTLKSVFGPEFTAALEQNQREHAIDCQLSCESFYCATPDTPLKPLNELLSNNETIVQSYSFGPVPPEGFGETFGFPLDLIKVTRGKSLFSAEEAAQVIAMAEAEGVEKNEYKSGKYRLGGDWLDNLPSTRKWFNEKLESTFFPLLAHLFPEIISSPAALRAHSVSLLKYNASHPRTDVHIDNGILALTVAMSPQDQYEGGGTFFEHMGQDDVVEMDVGFATLRPGSVRHGGHPVTNGHRYILGGFLLLEDRVEHVRRLKNRGTELRHANDLVKAAQQFEWALAINPKCTTCLKDWAEILYSQKQLAAAEEKIRAALDLLENMDSDALFTLGLILSEQGRDEESIAAYQQSIKLNSDDAELCYNLGIKLGAKGKTNEEMDMYARAVKVDPSLGGAWLNWGTALAEQGELDDAEPNFLKAIECGDEVAPKGMINLGLLYHAKSKTLAQGKDAILDA